MTLYLTIAVYSTAFQSKSLKEIRQAWHDGKDFKIDFGPYCSSLDSEKLKNDGYKKVCIVHANKKVIINL